jgi:hypothetical protein
MASISAALRRRVMERAGGCCEYCLVPDSISFYAHEIDHIVAEKHGGSSEAENLACACWRCNRHKGSDLTSLDPDTGLVVQLFHPRIQRWADHFRLNGAFLVPISATGRATAALLHFNQPARIAERVGLIAKGEYPPRHHSQI